MCVNDPYGTIPGMIKIALHIDVKGGSMAFMVSIKHLSLGRLLYIFVATPKPGVLEPMLKAVAPILDLVKFDILEASVNTFPFPVTLYSGTQIMGGIYFNVEYFNFFGLIKARRVMVHFSPAEGIFDIQIYVDPMKLEIGGITLLEVKGVAPEDKFDANAIIAEHDAKRAEKAKQARIEMQKIQA